MNNTIMINAVAAAPVAAAGDSRPPKDDRFSTCPSLHRVKDRLKTCHPFARLAFAAALFAATTANACVTDEEVTAIVNVAITSDSRQKIEEIEKALIAKACNPQEQGLYRKICLEAKVKRREAEAGAGEAQAFQFIIDEFKKLNAGDTTQAEKRTHTWSLDSEVRTAELKSLIDEIRQTFPENMKARQQLIYALYDGYVRREATIAGQKGILNPPQTHTTILPDILQPKQDENAKEGAGD